MKYGPLTLRQTVKSLLPRSTWDGNFERWDVVKMPEKEREFLCQSWFRYNDTDGQHAFDIDVKVFVRFHADRFHKIEVLSVQTDLPPSWEWWPAGEDEHPHTKESTENNIESAFISGGPYDL